MLIVNAQVFPAGGWVERSQRFSTVRCSLDLGEGKVRLRRTAAAMPPRALGTRNCVICKATLGRLTLGSALTGGRIGSGPIRVRFKSGTTVGPVWRRERFMVCGSIRDWTALLRQTDVRIPRLRAGGWWSWPVSEGAFVSPVAAFSIGLG